MEKKIKKETIKKLGQMMSEISKAANTIEEGVDTIKKEILKFVCDTDTNNKDN